MRFGIIEAAIGKLYTIEVDDERGQGMTALKAKLGLGNVDHAVVTKGISIAIAEFGLFEPSDKQHYFRIGNRLYAGNAVLYGYAESGDTIDLDARSYELVKSNFEILSGAQAVEEAIARGKVCRPEIKVNGEVYWRWPEPQPEYMKR
jgi:hypothetical protein